MKTTTYLESKYNWFCLFCHSKNIQGKEICDQCKHKKGVKIIIIRPRKYFTLLQWKQFKKFLPTDIDGETFYIDLQQTMCEKFKIIITDHINRKKVGKMAPTPIKEKLTAFIKNLPSNITLKNFDKGMKKFDKGMIQFSKAINTLTSGLGDSSVDLSKIAGNNYSKRSREKQNKKNLGILLGTKNKNKKTKRDSNLNKLWGKPQTIKRKKYRKKSNDNRSQGEKNIDILWGKNK